MKVYHECILKGKSEAETGSDLVFLNEKEKRIFHVALEEYVKNNKRKINAKKLLVELDALFGYLKW